MNNSDYQLLALAQRQLLASQLNASFSPEDLDSRPTPTQEEAFRSLKDHSFLDVSGGNQSGKTLWGARNVVWFCNRQHPYLPIDVLWPDQRILSLMLTQTTKLYEEHWSQKIRPFFDRNDYREKVQGGILQSVTFPKFNSKLLFFSYENPNQARDRLQGFVGHLVWIDELCKLVGVYEEAERRTQRLGGKVVATYTQKIRAPQTRRYLKSPSPHKAHFVFRAFDNPAYTEEDKAKILASINQFDPAIREQKRKQILEGEYEDDERVAYAYDVDKHGCDWPENYSRGWRHVEAVDPAASGQVGYVLFAEDPDKDILCSDGKTRAVWYVVESKYLNGEAPSDLVESVKREGYGYNIVRRVGDIHETWFFKEARKAGLNYIGPVKDGRKIDLIKGPAEAMKGGWLKVVDDGKSNELLTNEMGEAKWKEDGSGIVNSTKFHILDAYQYGYDKLPKRDEESKPITPHQALHLANKKRKKNEARREKLKQYRIQRRRRAR